MGDGFNINTNNVNNQGAINPILETDRDEDASPNIFTIKGKKQAF